MADALGRAVVGSLDGSVLAVDALGVVRAASRAPARVFASPAALDDLVIYGHDDRAFVALDERGREVWRVSTNEDADAPPVVGPGPTVFVASENVVALDRRGTPRWQRALGAHTFGAPALTVDAVVVTDLTGGLTWFDARDGSVRRRITVPAPIYGGALVLDDGTVVIGAEDGVMRAFGPDGSPRWAQATEGAARGLGVRATPALRHDGVIVVGAEDGAIYGLRSVDGQRVFRFATGYPVRSSACIDADDVAFVGGQDDAVHAIGPDGAERWRVSLGADVDSSPTLLRDGLLVVGCDDGALYALGD